MRARAVRQYIPTMRNTAKVVLLVGTLALPARTGAASGDPFADILPPERTTAQVMEFLKISPPPFTQEDVDRWVAEVRPVVERVAGRKFTQDPVVRVVTREKLTQTLYEQFAADVRRHNPERTPEQELEVEVRLRLAAGSAAPLMFGQYVDDVAAVLIPAENVPGLLGMVGCESTPVDAVVKIVLAHELTHALQHQTLGTIDPPARVDERKAFRAVMEGHAIYVQALVAEELGLAEGQRVLMTALAPARITDQDPVAAAQMESVRHTYAVVYRDGYRYMIRMAEEGGMDQLWEVVASPPKSLAEIGGKSPADAADAREWPGESVVFRAVADRLDAANWKRTDQRFAQAMLPVLFRDLADAKLKRACTEAFVVGGLSAWQRRDGKGVVMVNAVRVKELSDAPTMGRAFDELARAKHENMAQIVTVTPFQRDDLVIDGCDGGSRIPSTITVAPGQSMDMVITTAWRGKNFVSLSDGAVGADTLSDADVAELIRAVFDAMDVAE